MAKKKKQWYTMDDIPCIILKKGKTRLLVRADNMQPIAHNPLPLAALAGTFARTAIPSALGAIAGRFMGNKKEEKPETMYYDNKDIPNNLKADQYYIDNALKVK